FQLGSKIFIYDRFGKILKELSPGGEGWDGRYRGKPMPADDYWFTVALEDGRLRKGHFSLIRR
ncbi:MAG TPA: T9SS type B sorting domain-containing protein, partial [Flavobacteriia bacterium]|nr:T9SS type B sorting domain-containing protein [Flavobacteriia bacterium]